jgi:hypothetical protein
MRFAQPQTQPLSAEFGRLPDTPNVRDKTP